MAEARIQTPDMPDMREGRGVAQRIPPSANGRPKGLLPSSWLNRTVEVTLNDGECLAGKREFIDALLTQGVSPRNMTLRVGKTSRKSLTFHRDVCLKTQEEKERV
jgi:hypothetical protein